MINRSYEMHDEKAFQVRDESSNQKGSLWQDDGVDEVFEVEDVGKDEIVVDPMQESCNNNLLVDNKATRVIFSAITAANLGT